MVLKILMLILLIVGVIGLITNPRNEGGSIFVGAIALSAPYIAAWITKQYFAPKLDIEYKHERPYFRLTRDGKDRPLYYSSFCVKNEGRSQAKSCEAVLEELWLPNARGKPKKDENFLPVNLTWAMPYQRPGVGTVKLIFENINQKRKKYCNIGHIPLKDNKFFLDIYPKLKAQQSCILPGTAKIKIGIYADNATKIHRYFIIKWSGNWKDDEKDMQDEINISVQREERLNKEVKKNGGHS